MVIKKFKEISSSDTEIAGGKGASLGEMTQVGIPVPAGFVILATAFDQFLDDANLRPEVDAILHSVDYKVVRTVDDASEKIRAIIERAEISEELKKEIEEAFSGLNAEFVAVRSSATSEDSADAAWAGQLETFLNTNQNQLLENVKKCWSSLFTPRAIFYRFEKGLHGTPISVAVVVQKMVNSEKSGIAFSVHPVTQDRNQLIIEAGLGLGEAIVSGEITPDSYVVEKAPEKIIEISVRTQNKAYVRNENGNSIWIDLASKGTEKVLDDEQIVQLAQLVKRIEDHYGFPVDVEWAFEDGRFYITQSRPITTLGDDTKSVLWEKMISRNIPPLGWTAGAKYENEGMNIGKVYWKRSRELIVRSDTNQTQVFFDANDICHTNVLELLDDTTSLENFAVAVDEKIELIDGIFQLTPPTNQDDLLQVIDLHEKSFGYMLMALDLVTEIGLFLDEKGLISPTEKTYLFTPIQQTLIQRENATIQEYARKGGASSSELKKLAEEFGFIHQDYMGSPWGVEEYKQVVASEVKTETSLSDDGDFEIDKELLALSGVTRRLVYLYEEGRNAMVKAVSVLLQSPKLNDLGRDVVLHMTSSELRGYVLTESNVDKSAILKRENYFALYFDQTEVQIFSTHDSVAKLLNKLGVLINNNAESSETLAGSVANKGVARGKARLVFTQKDAEKVEDGEVIVSPMTAVEFLGGIRRASAIVTDEGGIICHAAIVSRELNIPCVIGTQAATHSIKTGDDLHVDANKGVVTIIKQ